MDELIEKINQLPSELKILFNRIFDIQVLTAKIKLPENLKEKFQNAENQKILIIKNKILHQETVFNIWRSKRPLPFIKKEEIEDEKICSFCYPRELTSEDEIGRLENERAITAANLAKSLKYHSLIIFKKHSIFDLEKDDLLQAFNLSEDWVEKIFLYDLKLKYIFLIWHHGYRAAASLIHPHFQIFAHYDLPGKMNFYQQKIIEYNQFYQSDYFKDLFLIHRFLDLAKEIEGIKVIASLTPFKDKELILLGKNKSIITDLILEYRKFSFNFNFFQINQFLDNTLSFLVDRGESNNKTSDIGSLEIYAYSVVGFDLLKFAREIFSKL